MSEKGKFLSFVFGVLTLVTLSVIAGCGTQPREDTVSIIDENHFEQLAASEDGVGNAAASIEILADGPAANIQQAASVPVAPAAAAAQHASTASAQASAVSAPAASAAPAASGQGADKTPFETKVQIALKNAGYYGGEADGKIGRQTREAIKSFQTANNLKADGVVGPNTWEILKKHYSRNSA